MSAKAKTDALPYVEKTPAAGRRHVIVRAAEFFPVRLL